MVMESHAVAEKGGYRSILKSTSLIGGASVVNMLIGMVRTKFVAILLGPAGVGLLGIYGQITGLVGTVTSMGIGSSGVRQIAEAVGTNDDERIARTVITLRRTVWLSGGFGTLVMIALSVPLSRMTFASDAYAWPIGLLGVTLLLASISTGQACLLQGMRRIADIARSTVFGALCSTLISIPCFYLWGQRGIVASLIFSAAATLLTSWWYARRVSIMTMAMSWRETRHEARALLALGSSFMGAALATTATAYVIQVLLVRRFGLPATGIYQAAYSLSGILVGFVLSAMSTDYYPRLTAVAGDNASVHRMVNEQSEISILLALPGLAAMMIFSPLIIHLFYSADFAAAVPILRWCILGILGRVFSWPLAFVMLAQGKGRVFIITEVLGCVLNLGAVFLFTSIWGLVGAGVAFMVVYIGYTGLMLVVMHRLLGATWTRHTAQMTVLATVVMVLLMINCTFDDHPAMAWSINLTVLAGVTFLCFRQLSHRSGLGLQSLLRFVGR